MSTRTTRIPKLTLGLRMLIAMHSAGYTTGEMAQKLKVSRHSATGWLYGRHQPNHSTLEKWSEICDVSSDWLINGQIEETSAGIDREALAKLLVDQLLGQQPRGFTLAELDLMPDFDIDLTREDAIVYLAPTG